MISHRTIDLVVLLNIEVSEGMWDVVTDEALIEQGISYAATIITNAISQGMTAGFAHNAHSWDQTVRRSESLHKGDSEHLLTILDAMSRIEMKRKLAFHSLLRGRANE